MHLTVDEREEAKDYSHTDPKFTERQKQLGLGREVRLPVLRDARHGSLLRTSSDDQNQPVRYR